MYLIFAGLIFFIQQILQRTIDTFLCIIKPLTGVQKSHKNIKMPTLKKFHFRGPYLPQNWSLPDSIIYYITMMPSNAKSYIKLVKSCTYFFSKNSICVADNLSLHPNLIKLSTDFCPWFCVKNLTVKLWITNKVESHVTSLSPIFPKLYKTDFKKVSLWDQTISYNDFLFISSNVEHIFLIYVVVKNEDSTIVPLEKLVKALPKIKDIYITENHSSSCITKNTVKELLAIPHFSKISKIVLDKIAETFDIETCFAFIKKNKRIKFIIGFHESISAAYKIRLEAIIDEILQTENHDYKLPFIYFLGCDSKKWSKLRSLFDKD